jgi:DNA-binding response OmpR family regulator
MIECNVAIVTGWGAQVDKEKQIECGVSYVLSKPFKMDELEKLIGDILLTLQSISVFVYKFKF